MGEACKVVVLIEDEPDLRHYEQILLAFEYEVRAPADFSGQGLFNERLWQDAYAAVIDLHLPGDVDGRRIVEWLRLNRPDVRRILVTGWPLDYSDPVRSECDAVLIKPYAVALFRESIEAPR